METFCIESILRGYHIYKDIPWEPAIGTTLPCERGAFNLDNPYAVAAMNRGVVVGRVSTISALYSIFLQKGEVICCEITGTRQYSSHLPQGGLELLKFSGYSNEQNHSRISFQHLLTFNFLEVHLLTESQ